jgi:hypothetical protein
MTREEYYNILCKERKSNYKGLIVYCPPVRMSAQKFDAQVDEAYRKALAWAKEEKAMKKLETINLEKAIFYINDEIKRIKDTE